MRPEWFDYSKIPYQQMWSDDEHWLPHVLDGKFFLGEYHFAKVRESQGLTNV
jgi:hypothetical protein